MKSLLVLAKRIAAALEGAGFPYAIGGAVALAYHAAPRATKDLDLNVFVRAEEVAPVIELLIRTGVGIDREEAVRRCRERGEARGECDGFPVDLFVNSIPLHESAQARRKRVLLDGASVWILAAEDLLVLKLLFFRRKDIVDSERIIAVQGSSLDREYARRQIVAHVGEDDPRVEEIDRMLAECASTPAGGQPPAGSTRG